MNVILDPEVISQIENMVAHFMHLYTKQMEKCANETEYFKLLISVFVFRNMIVGHFESQLKMEADPNPQEVSNQLQHVANIITQNILARSAQDSQMLN